jgi:hypothetical protein
MPPRGYPGPTTTLGPSSIEASLSAAGRSPGAPQALAERRFRVGLGVPARVRPGRRPDRVQPSADIVGGLTLVGAVACPDLTRFRGLPMAVRARSSASRPAPCHLWPTSTDPPEPRRTRLQLRLAKIIRIGGLVPDGPLQGRPGVLPHRFRSSALCACGAGRHVTNRWARRLPGRGPWSSSRCVGSASAVRQALRGAGLRRGGNACC